MKIKLSLKDFTRNLQVAMRAIAARPTLPILNYLLIDATGERITLTGYDMEMGIRVGFPGEIVEPGSVAVKARTLNEIVSQLSSDDIELEFNDISKVEVKSGGSEFGLVGKPGDEYPRLPEISDEGETLKLPVDKFLVNLKRTIFAASMEMPKNYTSGVLLNIKEDLLQIVATDGRRLALSSGKLEGGYEGAERAVLIPAKTMHELARIIGMGWEGDLSILLAENLAMFKLGQDADVQVITHLLDTPYPDFEKVIPETTEGVLTIDRNRLMSSLRQVGIIARLPDGRDMAILECKGDHLIISAKAESEGTADVRIPIERDGDDLKIAFNYQYLLDPLLAIEEDKITLSYSGSLEPGLVQLPGDESFKYVIMPVRLPDQQ